MSKFLATSIRFNKVKRLYPLCKLDKSTVTALNKFCEEYFVADEAQPERAKSLLLSQEVLALSETPHANLRRDLCHYIDDEKSVLHQVAKRLHADNTPFGVALFRCEYDMFTWAAKHPFGPSGAMTLCPLTNGFTFDRLEKTEAVEGTFHIMEANNLYHMPEVESAQLRLRYQTTDYGFDHKAALTDPQFAGVCLIFFHPCKQMGAAFARRLAQQPELVYMPEAKSKRKSTASSSKKGDEDGQANGSSPAKKRKKAAAKDDSDSDSSDSDSSVDSALSDDEDDEKKKQNKKKIVVQPVPKKKEKEKAKPKKATPAPKPKKEEKKEETPKEDKKEEEQVVGSLIDYNDPDRTYTTIHVNWKQFTHSDRVEFLARFENFRKDTGLDNVKVINRKQCAVWVRSMVGQGSRAHAPMVSIRAVDFCEDAQWKDKELRQLCFTSNFGPWKSKIHEFVVYVRQLDKNLITLVKEENATQMKEKADAIKSQKTTAK